MPSEDKKPKKPVGEEQRKEDEKVRKILQDADLKKFDEALEEAVKQKK